jgi:hypothetical protein
MTVAEQTPETTAAKPVHTRALIIGTGFSGIKRNVDKIAELVFTACATGHHCRLCLRSPPIFGVLRGTP